MPVLVTNSFFSTHGFQCFDWAAHKHIPGDRPNNFEGFVDSFLK